MESGSEGIENNDSIYMEEQEEMRQSGPQFDPEIHGLGKEKQRLTFKVQDHGIPAQTVPYHLAAELEPSEQGTEYDERGFAVNKLEGKHDIDQQQLWRWSSSGKLRLACAQPVVPVPIVQDILRRDKIILVPQVEVTDVIEPKIYNQNIKHEVPKLDVKLKDTYVNIPNVRYVEKEIVVPIITGYTHKFVPKWEIHEVPRPIMKYIGEQKIVEVDVPEIKYVDKIVEREVVVDTVEKRVPRIIEVPKYTDEVEYVWKPIEKIVYVQKLVPKFDVNLDCPPPLIVPYPVQTVRQIPPVMVRKDAHIPLRDYMDSHAPEGAIKVPEEYIKHYSKKPAMPRNNRACFLSCCDGGQARRQSDAGNSYSRFSQSFTVPPVPTSGDPQKYNTMSEAKSMLYESNASVQGSDSLPPVSAEA